MITVGVFVCSIQFHVYLPHSGWALGATISDLTDYSIHKLEGRAPGPVKEALMNTERFDLEDESQDWSALFAGLTA